MMVSSMPQWVPRMGIFQDTRSMVILIIEFTAEIFLEHLGQVQVLFQAVLRTMDGY